MKRLATLLFLVGIVFLTGCGKITGRWTLDCIKPETEKQRFNIGCLVLNDDCTFQAWATEQGKPVQMDGTYKYDSSTKMLTFTPTGGPARTYRAEVELSGKMKVCSTEANESWAAYMKHCACGSKDPCCSKCPACGKACGGKCPKSCPMQKSGDKKIQESKPDAKKAEPAQKTETIKIEPNKNKN